MLERDSACALIERALEERGLDGGGVDGRTRLSDLGVDSLGLVELVFELETAFGVEVDVESLQQTATLGELFDMLERAGAHGEPGDSHGTTSLQT